MTASTPDNDGIGVVFHYQDENNYERFSMDSQRHYRRLVKKVDGRFTNLAETDAGYRPGTRYRIRVLSVGSSISIYLNGSLVLQAVDDPPATREGRPLHLGVVVDDVRRREGTGTV